MTPKHGENRISRRAGISLAALTLGAGWVGSLLVILSRPPDPWMSILLFCASVAVGASSESIWTGLGWSRRPASYRWSALASCVVLWVVLLIAQGGRSVWFAGVVLIGALVGSAIASWVVLGLVEDNLPPPPSVRLAVLQSHRGRMNTTPPLSGAKRAVDVTLSAATLLVSAPLSLALAACIWMEQPGPVFFLKNSVGLGGKTFRQWKFRTMVHGAEDVSGPVLASEDDSRALRVGRFLRKTALDELPQLVNIVMGDMSFVGPRPQRTVLVLEYLQALPEYADRHQVRPGLAGLAQVAGDYYLTPRQKLRLDRLYVRHATLPFDLWLVMLAFLVVFWWRWRRGWRGHLTPAQIRGPCPRTGRVRG